MHVDTIVLSDGGNLLDVLFIATRAALFNCRVPATRSIQYKAQPGIGTESGLSTRVVKAEVADFELKDYWDDGEPLANSDRFPVAITLNVVSYYLSP